MTTIKPEPKIEASVETPNEVLPAELNDEQLDYATGGSISIRTNTTGTTTTTSDGTVRSQ